MTSGTAGPSTLYTTTGWADLATTPLPLWELIDQRHYATMNIQYSRGCPYDCEFCDITVLYGPSAAHEVRAQVIAEMDALYSAAGAATSSSWTTTSSGTG